MNDDDIFVNCDGCGTTISISRWQRPEYIYCRRCRFDEPEPGPADRDYRPTLAEEAAWQAEFDAQQMQEEIDECRYENGERVTLP